MPMRWQRIAWFFSFATAVVLATEMRHLGFGWPAALGLAVIVWIVLPFVISQLLSS
jgi:hypothetical protein